ncbi:MAG: class II aldolase/adducin family protein [Fidelibacterota bacterium]|nr:MAG: class II aldolase/adducin family protein [Candidatus Neomarinimicrobiota bacterium]
MPEAYTGPKFKTMFKNRDPVRDRRLAELAAWGRQFAEHGLTPGAGLAQAGNLSIRTEPGFIITAAGADLASLSDNDYIQVLEVNTRKRIIFAQGPREPSSESFLHAAVYQQRPEINAVLHGHDDLILRYYIELELPATAMAQPYGSLELMREIQKVLGDQTFIVIREHGFLALGETLDQAGEEALRHHDAALSLSRSAL